MGSPALPSRRYAGPGRSQSARVAQHRLVRVARRDHRHAGKRAHHADVLDAVVRVALRAVGESAADGHDAHRQAMVTDVVAHLLEAAQRREVGDRVREDDLAEVREPRGDAHHVLLGHADVEVLLWQRVAEALEDREAEVRGEKHHVGALGRGAQQFFDESGPHGVPFTSAIACSSCALSGDL